MSSYNRSDSFRNSGGSLFQRGGTAMVTERSANLSDEVTEGRSSVRAKCCRYSSPYLPPISFILS